MQCEPVVFSSSAEKREDAMKLGAKEFYVIPQNSEEKLGVDEGINVLLLCGGQLPDFEM